jgi:peptidoglycan/LPS O-acetylase OafA/YrhL
VSQPAAPRHLDALTGIRGIAAWAVVLYHIRLSLLGIFPAPLVAALGKGYLAVDLFFMLSGFVIWYNYAARIAAGGREAASTFLWRRFARVWPLHGAILAIFVAFAAALAVSGRDASGYPVGELPLHVLLLQNWGFTPRLSWNHPAWSISTEMAAYLLFPALTLALRWERLTTAQLLLLAVGVAAALHSAYAVSGYGGLGGDITHLGLLRCLAEFTMGCLLCQLWQRWRDLRPVGPLAAIASLAIVTGALVRGLPETAFVPAALFTALLSLAVARGPVARLCSGRALVYLGEVSYSTYLAHFLLFILYKIAFVGPSLQLGWSGLCGFLGLVLAASVVLYHGLEKPAQRWLNARQPYWSRFVAD